MSDSTRPIIVQGDFTILLETTLTNSNAVRDELIRFSELIKSPEYIHTYKITPLSIWNARETGIDSDKILEILDNFSKYPVPEVIRQGISDYSSRYGKIILEAYKEESLKLTFKAKDVLQQVTNHDDLKIFFESSINESTYLVKASERGIIKQQLIQAGFPVKDLAGFVKGDRLNVELNSTFSLRDYQKEAITSFYRFGRDNGGSGVVTLPCGSGKTIVGLGVMSEIKEKTLILTTSISSVKQWHREILDKTNLTEKMVAEYTGEQKDTAPVTISTYQVLTWRANKDDDFQHLNLFNKHKWGLIIYDEVHLLPAPIFRATSNIQATRRLGLTATLIREDAKEEDVFALIGPKRFDKNWRELEENGYIATATCTELRVPLSEQDMLEYVVSSKRMQFRKASENINKVNAVKTLLNKHKNSNTIIIGQYIDQLQGLAKELDLHLITGKTHQNIREQIFTKFKSGEIRTIVLSKIGNFAIDLPEADILIQVSGTFGSRQEEAQRLGRVLRPKKDKRGASFYNLVSKNTREEEFAHNRKLFLTEQGYNYKIKSYDKFGLNSGECNV